MNSSSGHPEDVRDSVSPRTESWQQLPCVTESQSIKNEPSELSQAANRLRSELKSLLTNPTFQNMKDADTMTDVLMQKLAEIADQEDSSASSQTSELVIPTIVPGAESFKNSSLETIGSQKNPTTDGACGKPEGHGEVIDISDQRFDKDKSFQNSMSDQISQS